MAECSVIMRTERRQFALKDLPVSLRGKVEVKNQDETEILSERIRDYFSHLCCWDLFSVFRLAGVANENWSHRYKI
jgi:hypothetical protein